MYLFNFVLLLTHLGTPYMVSYIYRPVKFMS